ncbi:MAG TPA: glycosyl hydrolase family 8 [Polyangiaceae bacterium]
MNRGRLALITLSCMLPFLAEAGCSNQTPEDAVLGSGSTATVGTGTAGGLGQTSATNTSGNAVSVGSTGSGAVGTAVTSTQSGATTSQPTASSAGVGGTGNTTDGGTTMGTGGRGPTPPSATANFPFPQNRESEHCVYPAAYSNADVRALYDAWKTHLVTADGAGGFRRVARVAEPGLQPNSTVSEGIAYGMLISVYMDDQALFDDLWRYALKYAWTSENGDPTLLMNWYIHADGNVSGGGDGDPAGHGAATDADEDIAFSLVMADRQWGGGGALERSYLEYAQELIGDIWAYEIADERLPKNGSGWGGDNNLNISYFAPAYYRVFAEVSGDSRWVDNVVAYVYTVIDNNLNAENGNEQTGLVPAWSQSNGTPASHTSSLPFHYQYDSCRTPFRVGQDACWHGDERARAYVAKTSSFFSGIGAPNIVDGYELNGTPRPEFPDSFGGLSGAFIGPAAVGAMHDGAFATFVDTAYALVRENNAWAGGQYYDESWLMMSILMMTGNFLDYTQYD